MRPASTPSAEPPNLLARVREQASSIAAPGWKRNMFSAPRVSSCTAARGMGAPRLRGFRMHRAVGCHMAAATQRTAALLRADTDCR